MWSFSVQMKKKQLKKKKHFWVGYTRRSVFLLLLHVWAKHLCICVGALVYWGYDIVFNDSYLCWWWMSLDLKRCVTGKGLPPVKLWHAGVFHCSETVKKSPDQRTVISFLIISRPRRPSFSNAYRFTALLKSISQIFPPQNSIKSSSGQLLSLQPSRMFTCQQNKSNNACCQMLPWTLCHSNSADCKTAAMCVPFISLMYSLSSFDWNKCITYLEYYNLGT